MKNLLIIVFILFSSLAGIAQNPIVSFEYYVDEDPGYMLATPIPITPGLLHELDFTIPTGGLSKGMHVVGMRGRDDHNNWSLDFIQFFYVDLLQSGEEPITQVEYFIDSDPGIGNATPVNITPGKVVDIAFDLDVNALEPGFHFLSVRSASSNNVWSHAYTRMFLMDVLDSGESLISQVEYFIDEDPGIGNATPIAITPGKTVELAFDIDLTSLEKGFHFISVRSASENNTWSHAYTRMFLMDVLDGGDEAIVTQVEYFVDEDPGIGNAIPVSITPGKVVDVAFEVDLSASDPGLHFISVRSASADEVWSHAYSRMFLIDVLDSGEEPVTSVEYFIDDDPGIGNANPVAITPGKVVDLTFEIPLDTLDPGFHFITVRSQSEAGTWSTGFYQMFYIDRISSINNPNLSAIEYFLDEDPGFGNGSPAIIEPPTPVADHDYVVQLGDVTPGEHILYMRARDEFDNWSIVAYDTVMVELSSDFALRFDGMDDYLEAGEVPFPEDDMTIEAWINPAEIVGYQEILFWYGDEAGVQFRLQEGGSLLYGESANGNWNYVFTADDAVAISRWTHIAMTKAGDLCKLYINGTQRALSQFDNNPITHTLQIGGRGNNMDRFFNGEIDEVRIWNVARTQEEIMENLCANLNGSEEGVYGLWHFNDGAGSSLASDSGPNGFGAWFNNMNPNPDPDCAWFDHSCELPPAIDLAINAMVSPEELLLASASTAVNITVKIRNFGIETWDGEVSLSYQLDGGGTISENTNLYLNPGDMEQFTFSTSVDLSVPNSYQVSANVAVPGDENPNNNTLSMDINSVEIGRSAYAYNTYSNASGLPTGPIVFDLENPEHVFSLADQSNESYLKGGTWIDGKWLAIANDTLYTINTLNGNRTFVGVPGSYISSLAYDPVGEKLYGQSWVSLYEIDPLSGNSSYKGYSGTEGFHALASDAEGNLYALNIEDDQLYLLNKESGEATAIGSIGFNAAYEQDMDFDPLTGNIYMAAFNEDAGQGELRTIDPLTGNSTYLGTFRGGMEVSGFAIPASTAPPVTNNNALHFDGTTDWVDVPDLVCPNQFTVECWVNYEGLVNNSYNTLVEFGNDNPWLGINQKKATIYQVVSSNEQIEEGWHHLAYVVGENYSQIFVDGQEAGYAGWRPSLSTLPAMGIGYHVGDSYWHGSMDELRIWDYARNQTEVNATMNQELSGNESGLVAYYNFNQGVAGGDNTNITTLYNSAASKAYNGTLNNYTLTGNTSNFVEAGWQVNGLVADFYANPETGKVPLDVSFTDISSGDIESWLWDFGDGNTSSEQHPDHTYTEPGFYSVSLTVSDDEASDTESKESYIEVEPLTIYDLQFTSIPGPDNTYPSPYADMEVTVSGIVNAANANGTANAFFVTSPEGGAWNGVFVYNANIEPLVGDEVLLTGMVVEYNGLTEIHSPEGTILSQENPVPAASFIFTADLLNSALAEPYEGCLAQVQNLSVTQIANQYGEWKVDDGSGACIIDDRMYAYTPYLGENLGFVRGAVYYNFGYYAINPRDESDIQNSTILADFSANITSGFLPLAIDFTDMSTGDPESWFWDFGDGNTSTLQNPSHIYQSFGIFTVSLTIYQDGSEFTETKEAYIEVYQTQNGDWSLQHICLENTPEAELMIRAGDIDNLGFGWPAGFDPFTGESTPEHGFPWESDPGDTGGTDRIIVVSSYTGQGAPCGSDGYAGTTSRPENLPEPILIDLCQLPEGTISSAALQIFVDDIQPGSFCSQFTVKLNGQAFVPLQTIVNHLNQSGPIGRMLTVRIPQNLLYLLEGEQLELEIDDFTTGAGDGFAIDFVKLLINESALVHSGTIAGNAYDTETALPLGDAEVEASFWEAAITAADGSYFISEAPAGLVYVECRKAGYQTAWQMVNLASGENATIDFWLEPALHADFSASPRSGNAPLQVQFTDQSSGEIESWSWNFGDGTVSDQQNPMHIYNAPGFYTVSLSVSDGNTSDETTKTNFIHVSSPGSGNWLAEYFFDNDPGYGNAIPIYGSGDEEVMITFNAPVNHLSDGFHTFYSRSKNENGIWSQTMARPFIKQILPEDTDPNISYLEYFFDNDPGAGQATPIALDAGSPLEVAINLPLESLPFGLHNLYVRAQDQNGKWSIVMQRAFIMGHYPADPLPQLVKAEYFIDEDPGQGLAEPVLFDPNNGIHEQEFDANLDGYEWGEHTLYMRTMDENGSWSITVAESFDIEEPPIISEFSADITQGSVPLIVQFTDETFVSQPTAWLWDFGDGNTATIQNPSHTYVDPGTYTVSLTASNVEGSNTEVKEDFIHVYPPIYALEYFFDNDPGYGNGNGVYAYSSNLGGFDFLVPVEELSEGYHLLFVRVQDTSKVWTQTFSRSFLKTTLLKDPDPNISKMEYFVNHDPGFGEGLPLAVDQSPEPYVEAVLPLEGFAEGLHNIFVRSQDENGRWSQTFARPFLKSHVPDYLANISRLEYFIDSDPGTGNGTAVSIPIPQANVVRSFVVDLGEQVPGEHRLSVRAIDSRGHWSLVYNQLIEVTATGAVQVVQLPQGWSGISSYVVPDDATLANIFAPVQDELVILQNFDGMFWPTAGVNTLGSWNDHAGYQVKMETAQQVTFSGEVQGNLTANLSEGWNYLPVLNACDNEAAELFSQIINHLQIVKEVAGTGVYWPQFGVNTLGDLIPGKAYFVLIDEDVELEFAECGLKQTASQTFQTLTGFETLLEFNVQRTPLTHTIALPLKAILALTEGSTITIHNQFGLCCGAVAVCENQDLALTVFGDDPTTPTIDGMTEGEPLQLRVFNPETGNESSLKVEFDAQMPQVGTYINHGLSAVKSLEATGVNDFKYSGLNISIYPNPSSGIFQVETLTGFETLSEFAWEVCNTHGSIVATGKNQSDDSVIDISTYPKGIYYLKITQGGLPTVEKLVVQ